MISTSEANREVTSERGNGHRRDLAGGNYNDYRQEITESGIEYSAQAYSIVAPVTEGQGTFAEGHCLVPPHTFSALFQNHFLPVHGHSIAMHTRVASHLDLYVKSCRS